MTVAQQHATWWSAIDRSRLSLSWPEIDGVRTRVLELGAAENPPLVLLHGTGGHLEAFVFNVAALAERHRVIAYDLPGHGWSSAPERSYEIDGYMRHLLALLERYGIERADLVGQSLGGWIATTLAARRGDRVGRLVLVGPGGTDMNPAVMARVRDDSMEAVLSPSWASVRRRLEMIIADPARITDELVDCRLRIYSQEGAGMRMERLLCLQDPEVRERNLIRTTHLRAVPHPTLVVAGDRDSVVPLASLERWVAAMPDATLAVLDGCGHWPQFEEPERFNELASSFLAEERG